MMEIYVVIDETLNKETYRPLKRKSQNNLRTVLKSYLYHPETFVI